MNYIDYLLAIQKDFNRICYKHKSPLEYDMFKMDGSTTFKRNERSLQNYLEDLGVEHFSAKEILKPWHPDIAKDLGWEDGLIMPPFHSLHLGIIPVLIADQLRSELGFPILCANWYRPDPYNTKVSSSSENSDHVSALAVDLQTNTMEEKKKLLEAASELYENSLFMSLGNYKSKRLHIGYATQLGRRRWDH